MSIHSEHPFLPAEGDRSPVRRLRARFGAGVSLWTTGAGRSRAGLTVSSMMVADGEPGRVVGLLDPDSDLWDALEETRTFVVSLLSWDDRALADAFAGVAPAPGGRFRLGSWTDSGWGPVLDTSVAWAGCRLVEADARTVGWSVLAEAVVEEVTLADEDGMQPLIHRRGRYHPL